MDGSLRRTTTVLSFVPRVPIINGVTVTSTLTLLKKFVISNLNKISVFEYDISLSQFNNEPEDFDCEE